MCVHRCTLLSPLLIASQHHPGDLFVLNNKCSGREAMIVVICAFFLLAIIKFSFQRVYNDVTKLHKAHDGKIGLYNDSCSRHKV